jgi:hypothetical protein
MRQTSRLPTAAGGDPAYGRVDDRAKRVGTGSSSVAREKFSLLLLI